MLQRALIFSFLATVAAAAQQTDAPDDDGSTELEVLDATSSEHASTSIEQFQWLTRPIIVLADSPNDPRFSEQMELLRDGEEQLLERDVIVLIDTSPAVQSGLRSRFRPRGFSLVIVGKDGEIKLRKPFPWSVREITRAIDKFPLRQQEIRSR